MLANQKLSHSEDEVGRDENVAMDLRTLLGEIGLQMKLFETRQE